MALRFCSPAGLILFVAFVLSFLVSISVPYIQVFDDVRVKFNAGGVSGASRAIDQFRLGIWGYCSHEISSGDWICTRTGVGYAVGFSNASGQTEYVRASWTRGLVVQPIATGVTFIAFLLSFSSSLGLLLVASLLSFFASLVTLIFLAINIALYLYTRSKVNDFGIDQNTDFGPAFWMSIVTFVLTLISGLIVCFNRNRESRVRRADSHAATTGYGRPTGWRRFVPGRKY
ncbi:hypothetical protein FRC02_008167 [Tulasnella sp. 418]|nr:hypothetical protein FRC02_008167 [Tulasnella sp. 418]